MEQQFYRAPARNGQTPGIPVFVLGSSGHAKVVLDIIRKQQLYNIAGVVARPGEPSPGTFCGAPVIGHDEQLADLADRYRARTAFVAIGDNFIREQVASRLRQQWPWLEFGTAVHPSAQIGDEVRIAPGTVVMAQVAINSGTDIGEFCIVNTSASIDHDNRIGDFASVGPGAVTGGNVTVGRSAVVGLGAHILHGRTLGDHSVVGSGSVAVADVPAFTVAFGVPAHVVRSRAPGDRYL